MGRFTDRVAVITGGSRGIGKEAALQLGRKGAKIAILDINEEQLNNTEKEMRKENLAVQAVVADVTKRSEIESAFEHIHSHFGRIDILINNAGIIRDNLFYKMTEQDWDVVMDIHLKGTFHCSQVVQSYMVKQQYGRIINISSTSALGNRGQANYATVKAGLQGLTKTLAIELGRYGVTVNAIAPGFIETEMTRETAKRIGLSFEDFVESRIASIPVKRSGKPTDVANAILFFADELSSFINGQVLYVAGGPKG